MKGVMDETFSNLQANFETHRIEGFTNIGNVRISCPLITQVDGNLWQGGCEDGVSLGDKFKHVISLYPWEKYEHGELDTFMEVRLFDHDKMPSTAQIFAIAKYVNIVRKQGPTLVHCQAGLNRSSLIVGTALILSGMKPADAIALMREKRCDAVLSNQTFESWLRNGIHTLEPSVI